MALTASEMLELGTMAPNFSLPDTDGKVVSLRDFGDAPALLVVFMCNHCPYVKHVRAELARLGRDCKRSGVAMVGINSNDADTCHTGGNQCLHGLLIHSDSPAIVHFVRE